MSNKTIFDLNSGNAALGDWMPFWQTASSSTRKVPVNRLMALSTGDALAIPLTGSLTGVTNAGDGDGVVLSGVQTGIIVARTLKEGANITITTEAQTVTISAADAPLVPIQSAQNIGTGLGRIFSGISGVSASFRTLVAGTGIIITTGNQEITISATGTFSGVIPVQSAQNIGVGTAQIFSGISGSSLSFRTLIAGTGISFQTGQKEITINNSFSTGSFYTGLTNSIVFGSGNSNLMRYGGADAGNPIWSPIVFSGNQTNRDMGSPSLNFPAGVGTYMIDFIFGVFHGSLSTDLWFKFYNTTAAQDLQTPYNTSYHYNIPNPVPGKFHGLNMKWMGQVSGPATIKVYGLYSGDPESTSDTYPEVASTGTVFSYIKLA